MNQFGVYGMGVMGQSIAKNIANHGYSVSVFDRFSDVVQKYQSTIEKGQAIQGFTQVEDFVASLESPRRILLMITAGKPVDIVIEQLLPYLKKDDIIIDGGNSYYKDTIRREQYCKDKGIHFFGCGISGGEYGALVGPSMMPGGDEKMYEYIQPVFDDICAKAKDGKPCCTYIGKDGSGHFVKMVHNGIEYSDIELICEAYQLLKAAGFDNKEISTIFHHWQQGELNCYLLGIAAKILLVKDEASGEDLIDCILDTAGQKGTGKWTSQEGLDMGVPLPTIAESVFARCVSALKEERIQASRILKVELPIAIDKEELLEILPKALYSAKIIAYAQGFSLMHHASKEYNWNLQLQNIASIWRGGCIIQARFLQDITSAYTSAPDTVNLMVSPFFAKILLANDSALRKVINLAVNNGIAIPGLMSSLNYFDSYRQSRLPANLLQALRDFFGAHTYQRVDRPVDEFFHTDWETITKDFYQ